MRPAILIALCMAMAGCAQVAEPEKAPSAETGHGTKMVLGRKLENPYSVSNMRKAYAALMATRADESYAGDAEPDYIETTHYYVKFIPKTEEEEDLLLSDSTIVYYPYPLDYEIVVYGEYEDSTVEAGQPMPLYASIPADMELPSDIEWEVLEDLYIPDEYGADGELEIVTRSGENVSEDFIESLVDKAMEITGNDDPAVAVTRGSGKWTPAGKITYYDNVRGKTIGMEGIEVKARRWFTTHTGKADSSGRYVCGGTFRRKANYSFGLERHHFHVKGQAVKTDFGTTKKTGDWDYHFSADTSSLEFLAATVFRAAYHYYYKPILGISRPPKNSFWRAKLKIIVHKRSDDSANGDFIRGRFLFFNSKKINVYNNGQSCAKVYGTTIHELAHAAHWRKDRSLFVKGIDDIVTESWARGVQYYLTRMVYPQYTTLFSTLSYTGIVIDLIDEANIQKSCDSYFSDETHLYMEEDGSLSPKQYIDSVAGYTLPQIEKALLDVRHWDEWKNNLKNMYENETEIHLDSSFDFWGVQ